MPDTRCGGAVGLRRPVRRTGSSRPHHHDPVDDGTPITRHNVVDNDDVDTVHDSFDDRATHDRALDDRAPHDAASNTPDWPAVADVGSGRPWPGRVGSGR